MTVRRYRHRWESPVYISVYDKAEFAAAGYRPTSWYTIDPSEWHGDALDSRTPEDSVLDNPKGRIVYIRRRGNRIEVYGWAENNDEIIARAWTPGRAMIRYARMWHIIHDDSKWAPRRRRKVQRGATWHSPK